MGTQTLFDEVGVSKEKPAALPAEVEALVGSDILPACRRDAGETSRLAARSMLHEAKILRGELVRAFVSAGAAGMTDAEAESMTGMAGNTLRPRRVELARMGLIVKSGERRLTPSGRSAAVWRVAGAVEGGGA